MTRTVLITGASGTVSSALIDALEGSGLHLRGLVRDESKIADLQARGVQPVLGNLDDPASLCLDHPPPPLRP